MILWFIEKFSCLGSHSYLIKLISFFFRQYMDEMVEYLSRSSKSVKATKWKQPNIIRFVIKCPELLLKQVYVIPIVFRSLVNLVQAMRPKQYPSYNSLNVMHMNVLFFIEVPCLFWFGVYVFGQRTRNPWFYMETWLPKPSDLVNEMWPDLESANIWFLVDKMNRICVR